MQHRRVQSFNLTLFSSFSFGFIVKYFKLYKSYIIKNYNLRIHNAKGILNCRYKYFIFNIFTQSLDG